jgi:hypothetical protein
MIQAITNRQIGLKCVTNSDDGGLVLLTVLQCDYGTYRGLYAPWYVLDADHKRWILTPVVWLI